MVKKIRNFNQYLNGKPYIDGIEIRIKADGDETFADVLNEANRLKEEKMKEEYKLTFIIKDEMSREILYQLKKWL